MGGWTSKAALLALGGLLLWLGAAQLVTGNTLIEAMVGLVALLPGLLFTGLAFGSREQPSVPVPVQTAVVVPFKRRQDA